MPSKKVKGMFVTSELGKAVVASAQNNDINRDEKGEAMARLGKFSLSTSESWDAYQLKGAVNGTVFDAELFEAMRALKDAAGAEKNARVRLRNDDEVAEGRH